MKPSDASMKRAREWAGDLRSGCKQTYMGGYTGEMYGAFVHGMDTVCNVVEASLAALLAAERKAAIEECVEQSVLKASAAILAGSTKESQLQLMRTSIRALLEVKP